MRALFKAASERAPSIIFIDEAGHRSGGGGGGGGCSSALCAASTHSTPCLLMASLTSSLLTSHHSLCDPPAYSRCPSPRPDRCLHCPHPSIAAQIDSILSSRSSGENDAMRRLKTEFLVQVGKPQVE